MFHSSIVFSKQLVMKLCRSIPLLMVVTGLFFISVADVLGETANVITDVQAASQGNMNTIRIMTTMEPAYTVYELFNPSRIVVDIAGASAADESSLALPESLPVSLAVSAVSDITPSLARLEFTFDNDYATYDVKTLNNDILLTVTMSGTATPPPKTAQKETPAGDISSLIAEKQEIDSQLPSAKLGAAQAPAAQEGKTAGESMRSSFTFGGYDKTRISVDFYKIDLHNVFRLIREISGINLVVDSAVSGSLTLALNDVPWDFALDIILNLKDLVKEERFNTIVILPKDKKFAWPERAEDNLDFEANEGMAIQEAIVIQQKLNQSPELIEARKNIQIGRNAEKKGEFEKAIASYSEAFAKWPDNDRLANKMASIYLVNLRQNARAVHFAKQALSINPNNESAALNAAVALANMQENKEAQQYFAQSVSGAEPTREALLSYAVFSEQEGLYAEAIKLLDKFETLHGANIDSMVAYARLLDKQGSRDEATEKYKSIMLSGYQIPPDLRKYINSRIALKQ